MGGGGLKHQNSGIARYNQHRYNGIVMYGLVIGFSGNLMGFHRNSWGNCGTSWEDLTI